MPVSTAGASEQAKASHSRPALHPIIIKVRNESQPGSGDCVFLAGAAKRAQPVQAVAPTAAMAPGGVEGSAGTSHPADLAVHQPAAQVSMAVGASDKFSGVTPAAAQSSAHLGVWSPGSSHAVQNTPQFLAALYGIQTCKPEGKMQVDQQCQVSSSGQDLGFMTMSVGGGVAQHFDPCGTSVGDVDLKTPSATASADSPSDPTVAVVAAAESPAARTAAAEASAAQTAIGATAASPAAARLSIDPGPTSAAAEVGPVAALPLFGGALKRAAQEANEASATPSQLHRLKRQRQTAEGDSETAADASVPQQADEEGGAVGKSSEEGKSLSIQGGDVGPHPFTMGFSQPSKRVQKKADRKGHSSRQKGTRSTRTMDAAPSSKDPAPPQDAQQSDAAQQVPPVLAMLPAQQQQPSLPESALSDVAAATLSSHVVDATGHQHTAEPAAGEGLLPKGISPTTDQCASGADEPPAAVVGQPRHHTAGPEQSEAPATASTNTVDTVPEHVHANRGSQLHTGHCPEPGSGEEKRPEQGEQAQEERWHCSPDNTGAAQAAMQGLSQHPAALSRLAHASGPANVAAAANESPSSVTTTSNVAAEPASIEAVEPAAGVASEPAASMAAEPACLVAGTAAEEEAKEATGLTPAVNHMLESTVRQGCKQFLFSPIPLVTTPPAHSASGSHMTGANPEPAAVQASGQHPTSTAPLSGETSAELPPDAAGEAALSITAASARNASSTRADTTVETQEGPAPVTHDAVGEEADPSRGGTAGTSSSDAAGSSAGYGDSQTQGGNAPASEQGGSPGPGPLRRKRPREYLNQGSENGELVAIEKQPAKKHKAASPSDI
ncbi:hypothetical protein WJX82_008337 [Trebouxia sp. C0006]